jgi:hypothetical protein
MRVTSMATRDQLRNSWCGTVSRCLEDTSHATSYHAPRHSAGCPLTRTASECAVQVPRQPAVSATCLTYRRALTRADSLSDIDYTGALMTHHALRSLWLRLLLWVFSLASLIEPDIDTDRQRCHNHTSYGYPGHYTSRQPSTGLVSDCGWTKPVRDSRVAATGCDSVCRRADVVGLVNADIERQLSLHRRCM